MLFLGYNVFAHWKELNDLIIRHVQPSMVYQTSLLVMIHIGPLPWQHVILISGQFLDSINYFTKAKM